MKTEDWQKVNEIVLDVLELSITKRQEFIEKCCAGMPEIRLKVESLLANESEAEEFFGESAASDYASLFDKDEDPNALVGQEIGNYRIIRELASGGMGVVYLAERADGKFQQKVALKLLKREMNTSALRRRFEQERAILASLEHPNIARLLDTGTTNDKIPFLAMEYVEGLPIDDYCNKNNLGLEARLDLFRKVCSAVSFAHRNLVIHRDLKPSNILVTDEGVPKLLDFGISKILSTELENLDSATITKLGVMTPSYASPEQIQNKSATTTTDLYSLGVILYELLSGHRPFEAKENDLKEIYKAVLEDEPPPPSALVETIYREFREKVNTKTEWLEKEISDQETKSDRMRQTLPNIIGLSASSLRGDLDNIVLKALRKEPERRYSSAENLAEDLHRYQRGLTVTARPNTLSYRAEKFFKRNKASAVVGILLVLAIVAGIVTTVWQGRVAAVESDRARLEAAKAKKINEYMKNVLNFSNPHWVSSNPKRNRDATIADALDEALKNIDTDLAGEAEIQAEILLTIGETYIGQGQYDKAAKLLQQSIEKFDQVLGNDNPKSLLASEALGTTLYLTGKYAESEKLYAKFIKDFRPKVDADKSLTKWFVIGLNDLGNIHNYNSNYAEAEKLYREGIEHAKNLTGRDRFVFPIIYGNLAWLLHSRGKFDEALSYYNQAAEELRAAGNQEQMEAGTLFNKMGVAYNEMGDYAQAENYYRKSYDILLKTVGEENFYTVSVMYRTAYNYYRQGRFEESEKLVNKSLEIQRKIFPNGHNVTAYSERLIGELHTKTGDLNKGEEFLRKALDYLLKKTKEPNRDISLAKLSLGENLIAQKRFAEAEEVVTSAIESSIKNVGASHPFTKQCRELLSKIPQNAGK